MLGNPATGVWPIDHVKKVSYEAFRNKPVGTGPYMVERWVHGEYIDLVKNPDYWDAENAGYVDRIHLPFMDVKTQWQEFQKGTIDFTSVPGRAGRRQEGPRCRDGRGRRRLALAGRHHGRGISQKSPRLGGDANLARGRRSATPSIARR